MQQLDIILILMAVLAVLYSVANRLKISYPVVLVVAGLVIGLVPGLPIVKLSPDIVFLIFLPPLLFEAARYTSWHDFRNNRAPIARLAIGLVFFTTASVAVCAHYMIPGFTWPLAFLLGAIVSPPDVVAATSATKGLNLPKRLITVLEGESLINDASALIAYRYALAAVLSGTFIFWHAALQFFVIAGGGIALGIIVGMVFTVIQKKFLDDATVETIATLLVPYVGYLLAEEFGISGVLTVVSTGLFVSWRAHELFSFRTRMQMNSFWNTLVFLLNGLVFILIGLQLPEIMKGILYHTRSDMIFYGLAISAVAIVTRILWIFPTVYLATILSKLRANPTMPPMNYKQLLIVGWAGMRGVVSLASALALPLVMSDGSAFPQRNTILFITFIVILVTLVLQGLTLPWLVRYLNVKEPDELNAAEEEKIRLKLSKSSLNFIDEHFSDNEDQRVIDELKRKFVHQVNYLDSRGSERTASGKSGLPPKEIYKRYFEREQDIIDHQRERVITIHKDGSASAQTLAKIEKELDIWAMGVAEKLKSFK